MCMHKIHLEEDVKPSKETEKPLNSNLEDVVKKEITKLRDVGIIYAISYSNWVSPIHVVPKDGGLTVVKNDN